MFHVTGWPIKTTFRSIIAITDRAFYAKKVLCCEFQRKFVASSWSILYCSLSSSSLNSDNSLSDWSPSSTSSFKKRSSWIPTPSSMFECRLLYNLWWICIKFSRAVLQEPRLWAAVEDWRESMLVSFLTPTFQTSRVAQPLLNLMVG